MNKRVLPVIVALCLRLTGCASLLERSYSVVEPYTDRYWDSGAEDTLKVENYQDLVNSLLMLVEQRSEEVVIRYYAPEGEDSYSQAISAKREVQKETILGSYLLSGMSVIYASGDGFCTLTYCMSYRGDAQDVSSLVALSDSESLVDLLRFALREGHGQLTARFISKVSREEVVDAVEELWRDICLEEMETNGLFDRVPHGVLPKDEPTLPDDKDASEGDESSDAESTGEEDLPADSDLEERPSEEPEKLVIQIPPCPWVIRFYPDADFAEIVEIVLR